MAKVGDAYVKVHADGSGLDREIKGQFKDAGAAAGDEFGESFDEAWGRKLQETIDQSNKDMANQNRGFRSQLTKNTQVIAESLRETVDATDDWRLSVRRAEKAFGDADRAFTESLDGWQERLHQASGRMDRLRLSVKNFGEGSSRYFTTTLLRVVDLRERLQEATDASDHFGDSIGRAFGKGARNNFVNLVGAVIGNIVRIPSLLARAGGGFIDFFGKMGTAFDDAGGGASGVTAALRFLLIRMAAVGAGVVVLTGLIGGLTSALQLAGGGVIALAGSLSFALVGAIGAVAGALVPMVAGLAVAIIGFANMDKAAKESLKGVTNAFKGLGDVAADEMFDNIGATADRLEGVVKGLSPLMRNLAGAVRDVFDGWIDGMDSPQFNEFRDFVARTMPDMIRTLGQISGNLGDTIAGIWIVATPYIQDFLTWLERVTDEWGKFANTASGRNQIGEFFDNAATSLIRVAGFLDSVIELVGTLLAQGRQTGDNIFYKMETAIRGWNRALQADPEILNRFFNDAERFADVLGDVVVAAGKMVDTLDSPATRDIAVLLGQTLVNALESLAFVMEPIIGLINSLDNNFAALLFTIGLLAKTGVGAKFAALGGNIDTFAGNVRNAETRMGALKTAAAGVAGTAGLGLLIHSLGQTDSKLATTESAMGGFLTGLSAGGKKGGIIGAVAGGMIGLISSAHKSAVAIEASAKAAENASVDYESLTASLDQASGAYTEASEAAAYKTLVDNGAIDTMENFGLSANKVVRALTGDKKAQQDVAGVRQLAIQKNEDLTGSLEAMRTEYARLQGNYRENSAAENQRKDDLAENIAKTEDTIAANKKFVDTLDDVGAGFRNGRESIREQTGALTDWRRVLGKVPKKVTTRLEAGNFPTTMKNVAKLFARYDIAPKRVRTYLEATGVELSERKVRRLIKTLNDAEKKETNPKVDVDIKQPTGQLATIAKKLRETDVIKTAPKIDAETKDFDKKASDVKRKADETGRLNPKIKVDAETSQATSDLNGIQTQVNNLPESKTINIHTNYTSSGNKPRSASGGIFAGAQERLIGEEGPEAIVPLSRPLSQVDPSVRALSAIAQGLQGSLVTNPVPTQRPINITIVTPTKDPHAVALETVNRLTAVGY